MKYRLAADYECSPVWKGDGLEFRNIDPASLPVPPSIAEAIIAWSRRYDATYNRADPAASGFSSPAEEEEFDAEGRRLWTTMEECLGADDDVEYFSILRGWESRG